MKERVFTNSKMKESIHRFKSDNKQIHHFFQTSTSYYITDPYSSRSNKEKELQKKQKDAGKKERNTDLARSVFFPSRPSRSFSTADNYNQKQNDEKKDEEDEKENNKTICSYKIEQPYVQIWLLRIPHHHLLRI